MLPLARANGEPLYVPHRDALASDRVRFVGDAIAFVVAETADQARDAAELVEVEYEELPALVDVRDAVEDGAPLVWDDCAGNVTFEQVAGDQEAVEAAFAKADHVTRLDYRVTRIAMNPMEPRAALAAYDRYDDRLTLVTGIQGPHLARRALAQGIFRVPETKIRVVSPDMGGAFGMRSTIHPELILVLHAARRLGRPVKWVSDRSEGFLSDEHGRDSTWRVELALDKDGTFLGLRARFLANMGAYLSMFGPFPAIVNNGGIAGVYRTPAIQVAVSGVLTTTTPIAPYRGAGRPEATLAIERAIDKAALEMGVDRIELRRRNMIAPDEMPFQTGLTFNYDSGHFEENMDKALAAADYAGFEARRAEAKARGKLRGIGVANAIEQSAGGFEEYAQIRFDSSGAATVLVGTHNHGQGHDTVFKQLVSEKFGIDADDVRIVSGDTDLVPYGTGTFGSRSSGVGGAAISNAAEKIIEKATLLAGTMLEASVHDIEFDDGVFRVVGTDRTVAFQDAVRTAFVRTMLPDGVEPGMTADGTFVPPAPTFPNGCHVSEIEIDPETGRTTVERYTVVDDVGTVMNPMLLKGQIRGGVVQGIGQILLESVVWDEESGQLVSGSFMDYCMPRADDMPNIEVASNPAPTPTNPLGIKGAGEAGTVGGFACLMNAVHDALAPLGVTSVEMPATPERVWRAIRDAV